jgi:hypothetical protein
MVIAISLECCVALTLILLALFVLVWVLGISVFRSFFALKGDDRA